MAMPEEAQEQLDIALNEAWEAAERCNKLIAENNTSSALVWAARAQAWASVANAVASRIKL
ncbi:MAG: hypothetical protein QOG39_781 [Acidimicrobiaceae bacterium]